MIESGYILVLSLEETALSVVAVTVRSYEYLAAIICVVKCAFFHFDYLLNSGHSLTQYVSNSLPPNSFICRSAVQPGTGFRFFIQTQSKRLQSQQSVSAMFFFIRAPQFGQYADCTVPHDLPQHEHFK